MRKILTNHTLIIFGWLFVLVGAAGAVLPILPTTPFLIVALALFSKSSPRFHQMLLHNRWFGPVLQDWEENRTMARPIKYKASFLIVLTFSISAFVSGVGIELQLMLLVMCITLLFFIWRIQEPPKK
jgi:uncharacterized membrane protein YbaN (DUF454 family)